MGVVYRASQISLGRTVALKVIAERFAEHDAFRDRFVRESRLAASIDHPNVIPVYAAGEEDGMLYIAMRFVDGTDLRTLLARGGPLAPRRAANVVAQVAAALDAAHERGLVHRDVKPANVLVAAPGAADHVYLTDFGLTKRSASDSGLTASGEWVGTIDYVAPEQLRGDRVDGHADTYALGCVLYEALTGHVPFPSEDDVAKLWAHISVAPPSAVEVAPNVPPATAAVVRPSSLWAWRHSPPSSPSSCSAEATTTRLSAGRRRSRASRSARSWMIRSSSAAGHRRSAPGPSSCGSWTARADCSSRSSRRRTAWRETRYRSAAIRPSSRSGPPLSGSPARTRTR